MPGLLAVAGRPVRIYRGARSEFFFHSASRHSGRVTQMKFLASPPFTARPRLVSPTVNTAQVSLGFLSFSETIFQYQQRLFLFLKGDDSPFPHLPFGAIETSRARNGQQMACVRCSCERSSFRALVLSGTFESQMGHGKVYCCDISKRSSCFDCRAVK